jgi:hypothetical protein
VARRRITRALSAASVGGSLTAVALAGVVLLDGLAEVFAWAVGGMAGRLLRDAGAILGPAEVWAMLRAAIWALLLGMIVGVAAVAAERSRPWR